MAFLVTLPNQVDASWIAGLLEGEGCFFTSPTNCPGIKICMTDRDVLERYGALISRPVKGPYKDNRAPRFKPRWEVNLYGQGAIDLMLVILPMMGNRRADKIRSILVNAEQHAIKRPVRVKWLRATCHPNLARYHASGLCRNCYERGRRASRKSILRAKS